METCETPNVVLPSMWVVDSDVHCVFFAQLFDGLLDVSVVKGETGTVEMWKVATVTVCGVTDQ